MTRAAARCLVLVALIGVVAAAGGCSQQAPAPSPQPDAFSQLVDGYLQDAEADGASEEQIATLKSARAAGKLTFEEYSAAIESTLECIEDAGFHVERNPTGASGGLAMVNYFYESPESGNPVAEVCIRANSEAIEAVYQLQPTSVATKEAHLETQADELARCLEAEGFDVDFAGLTGDELADAIHDVVNEKLAASQAEGSDPQMDCFVPLSQ